MPDADDLNKEALTKPERDIPVIALFACQHNSTGLALEWQAIINEIKEPVVRDRVKQNAQVMINYCWNLEEVIKQVYFPHGQGINHPKRGLITQVPKI